MNKKIPFDRVIVIGYGWIVNEVVKHMNMLREVYLYKIEYIEHEVHAFNTAKAYCAENGILDSTIEDKKELTAYLSNISEKTLIISASNNYLFPATILDNELVTVINFHNALLPKFPGRNAPSWVIYEGEEVTGITWHYVTSRVDAGNIIIQKTVPIDPDIKAYELASTLMTLAFDAFKESIEKVLTEEVEAKPQIVEAHRKMYLSKDVPGDAIFDVTDSWKDIYRLLRATDYAKYDIFPPVTTTVNGNKVKVVRYKIVDNERVKNEDGYLIYPVDDNRSLQIKYKIND